MGPPLSPRSGGEADKLGNRYEGAWAVRHALYCLLGEGRSLTVEDVDPELAKGSEFTYVDGGVTEVHQAKRQLGNSNNWSVKALGGVGVFEAAVAHVVAGRRYRSSRVVRFGSLPSVHVSLSIWRRSHRHG
jgi:hypothetical protein